jgi:hypothetical protein
LIGRSKDEGNRCGGFSAQPPTWLSLSPIAAAALGHSGIEMMTIFPCFISVLKQISALYQYSRGAGGYALVEGDRT